MLLTVYNSQTGLTIRPPVKFLGNFSSYCTFFPLQKSPKCLWQLLKMGIQIRHILFFLTLEFLGPEYRSCFIVNAGCHSYFRARVLLDKESDVDFNLECKYFLEGWRLQTYWDNMTKNNLNWNILLILVKSAKNTKYLITTFFCFCTSFSFCLRILQGFTTFCLFLDFERYECLIIKRLQIRILTQNDSAYWIMTQPTG